MIVTDPYIGTAGWTIPTEVRDVFPAEGPAIVRYAARLRAVEINSSFHRPHRRSTYERWAASVPPDFRFAVKLPKAITHQQRLLDTDALVDTFASECGGLGRKLGVLLVQLPPSLAFDLAFAETFDALAAAVPMAGIACEPRHASWFDPVVDRWLAARRIARVAADPARNPGAELPGGWRGLTYLRLHGSPVVYRSAYSRESLSGIARILHNDPAPNRWCIFDNTAASAALPDALRLLTTIAPTP